MLAIKDKLRAIYDAVFRAADVIGAGTGKIIGR